MEEEKPNLNDAAAETARTAAPEAQAVPEKQAKQEAQSKDCRDNCMHCGFHCIYLKNNQD